MDNCRANQQPDGLQLLHDAQQLWAARADFRADRLRNKRYTYGRQWDDVIEVDGRTMTEGRYIQEQGSIPLKNNLIRRLVRSVLGVWRQRWREPVCHPATSADGPRAAVLTRLMHANASLNRLDELYSRSMEEFLISGFVVHRKWHGRRDGRTECWTDCVDPDSFFMDTSARDLRGWDIRIVGQLHDLTPESLEAAFGHTEAQTLRLRDIYAGCTGEVWEAAQWGFAESLKAFCCPSAPGRCRVIEVWRREADSHWACHDPLEGRCRRVEECDYERKVMAENRHRLKAGQPLLDARKVNTWRWRYYYLSPSGHVLHHGDSPYTRFGHPYVVKAYPFIDGEIHSFVADVIDQQRYANRLITLYDWVMRASAKGVLLFPQDALPDGADLQQVADQWSCFNGVIAYNPQPGQPVPQQVCGNTSNLGIIELLTIQMKMLEDVSGVNAALQGRTDSGAVSGTLFDQQTRNSLTSLLDILETFDGFVLDAASHDAANICAFGAGSTPPSYFEGLSYDIHLDEK